MKKKIAIITGASSGLGREFVRQLDKKMEMLRKKNAGAEKLKENPKEKSNDILDEMWVIARREERLNELCSQISTTLRVIPLDLTQHARTGLHSSPDAAKFIPSEVMMGIWAFLRRI